jgi:undecaprenyl-diphosphatase
MAASVRGGKQADQLGTPGRLEQDRLGNPVGRLGPRVDLETETEVGQVGDEQLGAAARFELAAVEHGANLKRRVLANGAGEGVRALAKVGRVLGVVTRTGPGVEPGAHRLERVERALGRLHSEGIEGTCRRPGGHSKRRGPIRRNPEGPRDVVGPPRRHERELGKVAQARVRGGVQRAVAAHQDQPAVRRSCGPQRLEQLVLAAGQGGFGGRAELRQHRPQLVESAEGVVDAARVAIDREEQARRAGSLIRTLLSELLEWDQALIDLTPALEHPVLTAVFVALSAWWVKGPLLLALGLGCDLWRRRLPLAFGAAAISVLSASLVVGRLKDLFERARPPEADPGLGSLVAIPTNASFPSGHAATAFAAATAIAILSPRMRPYALGIAAAVALSRVYLRVHFPLDVLAGAALGAGLGALAAWTALRLSRSLDARPA